MSIARIGELRLVFNWPLYMTAVARSLCVRWAFFVISIEYAVQHTKVSALHCAWVIGCLHDRRSVVISMLIRRTGGL